MSAATIKTDELPLPIFSLFSLSGHQRKLVGQGGISYRDRSGFFAELVDLAVPISFRISIIPVY